MQKTNMATPQEYAEKHNKSESVIRYHCKMGNLKTAVKIGGRWFVSIDEELDDGRYTRNRRKKAYLQQKNSKL